MLKGVISLCTVQYQSVTFDLLVAPMSEAKLWEPYLYLNIIPSKLYFFSQLVEHLLEGSYCGNGLKQML